MSTHPDFANKVRIGTEIGHRDAHFSRHQAQQERARAEHEADVYEQLGRLQMELAWLKKKSAAFS
ncbi:MAG: hypothetical protein H0T73_23960 [Ardenticatenales bacterium]|nr:hypothetical protein [Ardenticatenales bacterium]